MGKIKLVFNCNPNEDIIFNKSWNLSKYPHLVEGYETYISTNNLNNITSVHIEDNKYMTNFKHQMFDTVKPDNIEVYEFECTNSHYDLIIGSMIYTVEMPSTRKIWCLKEDYDNHTGLITLEYGRYCITKEKLESNFISLSTQLSIEDLLKITGRI